ncbi:hypothetical protein NMG60_11022219 [Bertholletia excelsa]
MEGAIVLYPSPGMGHLLPMVEFGKLLLTHCPSFSITVLITTFSDDAGAAAASLRRLCATAPSIVFHYLPAVPPPPNSSLKFEELAFELPRLSNPYLLQFLQQISQRSRIRACVIDFFCNAAMEVTTSLSIPTYYFFTSGASGLCVLLSIPAFHEITIQRIKDPSTFMEYPGVPPIPIPDLPRPFLYPERSGYKNFLNTAIQMAKSSGILANSFVELEPKAVKAICEGFCTPDMPVPPFYCIGPLIANGGGGGDEHMCLNWLDSQPSRSVVFLCFGSMGRFGAEQLKEMAIGLEQSAQRFLWVVRSPPAEEETSHNLAPSEPDLESLLPEGFLGRIRERGMVVKSWAPQAAVLSHGSVGGFVTHCGWNSVLEAVCGGVPMLAWPLYAEQKMNKVFLVDEMRVALKLETREDGFVSAAELGRRVRELMESENGRAVRQRAEAMREAAKAAMGEEGASRLALAKLVESWKQDPARPGLDQGQTNMN